MLAKVSHCSTLGAASTRPAAATSSQTDKRNRGSRRSRDAAPESALATYLKEGAALLAATTPADLTALPDSVSDDFEHLRWFDLPKVCLERTA